MGTGGLLDGTTRLSRGGEPVYHYSFISSFAEACVLPERSCVPIPKDVPFEIAGLVGCAVTTGVGAVWRTAGVRPGERVAVIGCGGGRRPGACALDCEDGAESARVPLRFVPTRTRFRADSRPLPPRRAAARQADLAPAAAGRARPRLRAVAVRRGVARRARPRAVRRI